MTLYVTENGVPSGVVGCWIPRLPSAVTDSEQLPVRKGKKENIISKEKITQNDQCFFGLILQRQVEQPKLPVVDVVLVSGLDVRPGAFRCAKLAQIRERLLRGGYTFVGARGTSRALVIIPCLVMVGNLSSDVLSVPSPLDSGRELLPSMDVTQAEDILKLGILNDSLELISKFRRRLLGISHRKFVWLPGREPTLGVESWSMLHWLGLRDIASSQHDLALGKFTVGMNEIEAECVIVLGRKHS